MGTSSTTQGRTSKNSVDLGILLVALTLLAYIPVLSGGFIWDDQVLITDSRAIKAHDGLYRIWCTTQTDDYYPVTESLWWLQWRLWGNNAAGYHVVNVLLHAANAVLVWMILMRLQVPGAWLAACIFAIHPVNVETAAWVSEQKNTLSMLFYAVAILLYVRFYEEDRWRWYGWSLVAFVLALLSKAAVVMLPVVLLGCVWWTRGRVLRKDALLTVPFFALSLIMGLVTIWYQYHVALGEPTAGPNHFAFRLASAGYAPWFYLYKVLWPVNLIAIYPKWQMDSSRWISYVPGVLVVMCFLLLWWKRRTWGRPLLFGLGYFVVMFFPVLGLLKQGPYRLAWIADRADHYQYYSIVGVIALAVAGGEAVCRRMARRWPNAPTVAAVAVLIALGAGTWRRSGVFASSEALWRDTIARNPRASVAYLNLGLEMVKTGRLKDAVREYQEALRVNPDFAEAHNNLGTAFLRLDKVPEAIEELQQALRLKPGYVEAHNNLGTALVRAGRLPEAIGQWEEAIRIKPDFAQAHGNLGNALQTAGKAQEAIGQYEEALRIDPDNADAHNNLGNALLRQGKVPEAIEQYTQALAINPNLTAAQNSLARLQGGR